MDIIFTFECHCQCQWKEQMEKDEFGTKVWIFAWGFWPWLCFQPFIFNNWIDYAWKWSPFFCWNCMCTFNYLLFMSWILRRLFFTPQYCWVIKSLNCMNITSLCFKMHVCPTHWIFQFLCQVNDPEVIIFYIKMFKILKSVKFSQYPN